MLYFIKILCYHFYTYTTKIKCDLYFIVNIYCFSITIQRSFLIIYYTKYLSLLIWILRNFYQYILYRDFVKFKYNIYSMKHILIIIITFKRLNS